LDHKGKLDKKVLQVVLQQKVKRVSKVLVEKLGVKVMQALLAELVLQEKEENLDQLEFQV